MNNFGLWFAKTIAFLVALLPRSFVQAWGHLLGFLWWDVLRLRRFTIFRNLCIVFPDLSKQQKIELARKSLYWMGINFIEFLRIPRLTENFVRRNVIFEGIEHYESALRHGRGVLLLSPHVGNGDAAVAMMSLAGMRMNLISKKFKQKWINDFWFGVRESKGTKFIDPHGSRTPFDILKATGKNEAVVFVLDQFMGKPYGIETSFFGRKTGTAYGLALFALKTGAPVLPTYTYTDADEKMHIVFESAIETVTQADRDLQIREMTEKYNRALEKIILRHPEQWMWVHRRWKKWE